jgi:hypothetical protein
VSWADRRLPSGRKQARRSKRRQSDCLRRALKLSLLLLERRFNHLQIVFFHLRQVFPISIYALGNGEIHGDGLENLQRDVWQKVKIRAAYEIPVSRESKEQGVWTGKLMSPLYDFKPTRVAPSVASASS